MYHLNSSKVYEERFDFTKHNPVADTFRRVVAKL